MKRLKSLAFGIHTHLIKARVIKYKILEFREFPILNINKFTKIHIRFIAYKPRFFKESCSLFLISIFAKPFIYIYYHDINTS